MPVCGFFWEEFRTLQTAPPRDHWRAHSFAIKRTGPRPLSPRAFAPRDISFFSPKNKTCIFTGRSSDSASSPRPLLGINTNGLWPRLHFTAAVLSETCTPFPILPPARAVPARRRSGTCEYPCILLCLKYSISGRKFQLFNSIFTSNYANTAASFLRAKYIILR